MSLSILARKTVVTCNEMIRAARELEKLVAEIRPADKEKGDEPLSLLGVSKTNALCSEAVRLRQAHREATMRARCIMDELRIVDQQIVDWSEKE